MPGIRVSNRVIQLSSINSFLSAIWILSTGFWADNATWIDTAVWKDV